MGVTTVMEVHFVRPIVVHQTDKPAVKLPVFWVSRVDTLTDLKTSIDETKTTQK